MARASINQRLAKDRPPRVHITYEVETNGAMKKKEIPFVVGVLGEYAGDSDEQPESLADRKFTKIDRDNFDKVLKQMAPTLLFEAEDTIKGDGTAKIPIELKFGSLADFSPEKVAQQVEPIRELLELRQRLGNLRGKLQGNQALDEILRKSVQDPEMAERLKKELSEGSEGDSNG